MPQDLLIIISNPWKNWHRQTQAYRFQKTNKDQWIPEQSDILANSAKQACSENMQRSNVTYTATCVRIRHMVKNPPIQNDMIMAEIYSAYSSSREGQIENRRDQILLVNSVLRKYKGLRAYKSLLDGSDPTAIRSRKIFNTGCRHIQRLNSWDLNFCSGLGKIGLFDKAPCTCSGTSEENSLYSKFTTK